jgi:hypothetical protein
MGQGANPQMFGQNPALGMGFGPMLGGNPGGLTPEMLQQLAVQAGGPQMMSMAMLPQGLMLPGGQQQNPSSLGQQGQGQQGQGAITGINPMSLQSSGLGQMGGQNIAEMMRQQQAIQ